MAIQFVKRHQMAFDFSKTPLATPDLPEGFRFVPWEKSLLEPHADIKHRGFRDDPDGAIFPTFREYERCLRLMEAISSNRSFQPKATLLIARGGPDELFEYVANIQGMQPAGELGAIQNVAVLPEYRNRGLGRALLLGSLRGFRLAGARRVTLEVTADNQFAVRLYEHVGFKTFKTYFREIYHESE